eukprot:s1200_g7.t1
MGHSVSREDAAELLRGLRVSAAACSRAGNHFATWDGGFFDCCARGAPSRPATRLAHGAGAPVSAAGTAPQRLAAGTVLGLVVLVQSAEKSAVELNTAQIGTDALLLSLLSVSEKESPNAQATRAAAFPGIDAEAVTSYLKQRSASSASDSGRKAPAGGPKMFTPMTQRALSAAQQEQERLGHAAVEPAHLLLALLKEEQGQSMELLQHFDQNTEEFGKGSMEVRRRLLMTLEGPLAKLRLDAANVLKTLKEECEGPVVVEAPKEEPPLAAKLSAAHQQLTEGLVERSVEAKLLLLAALSGEHLFLLGPPGTAKSLLARRLALVCRGQFFERLLTRFSVPEEVFGPLSLRALENDELRRKVENYLPTADVAFLDEIFKANSSILNALLTLLNERRFDNGGERSPGTVVVPLWCAVAASNELPESDELDALFDRFLLRRQVPRVSDGQVPEFLRSSLNLAASEGNSNDASEEPMLSVMDSVEAQSQAEKTTFPSHLLDLVEAEPPVNLSDRRLGKAVRLLRLSASLCGAKEVSELDAGTLEPKTRPDLLLLQHICWDKEPSQATEVRVWLLERMRRLAQEDGEENDLVGKVKFLLNGLKLRLRRTPRASGTLSMAGNDLPSMREVLTEVVKTRRERLAQLKQTLQERMGMGMGMFEVNFTDHHAPRLFWLEASEILEAEDALIPSAEQSVEKAEAVLKDVLELQGALDLAPTARDICLDPWDALLDDFGGDESMAEGVASAAMAARGHGMLGPAPSGFGPPSVAANPNMYGQYNNQPLGQSIVVPNSQMPTALRGGPPHSPMSAERHARLQQILNRFEVSIAEANDLAVLEDYEIVLILDDSGSMNASSKPPEQRSLMQASTTRWEELRFSMGVKQLSCRSEGCDADRLIT